MKNIRKVFEFVFRGSFKNSYESKHLWWTGFALGFFLGWFYCLKNWLYFLSQYKVMIKMNSTWNKKLEDKLKDSFKRASISGILFYFLALQDYFVWENGL